MEKITELKMPILQKISEIFGYDVKHVMGLHVQNITFNDKKAKLHVARIGLTEHENGWSDILIYIEGYGGVVVPVYTKCFYQNGKRKKIKADENRKAILFDVETEKQLANIIWNNGWGYYDSDKNFISITELPKESIKIDVIKAGHIASYEEIIRINNSNVLVFRPEDIEQSLHLLDTDCSNQECLHDDWCKEEEIENASYHKINELFESETNPKAIKTKFYEWLQEKEDEE